MMLAVFSGSAPEWTPEKLIEKLASGGWDGVEFGVIDLPPANPPRFWSGNRAHLPLTGLEQVIPRIREAIDRAGIGISAIAGYADAWEGNLEKIYRMIDATEKLGATQLRVNAPSYIENYNDLFRTTREVLKKILARSEASGVKILVELHHARLTTSASAAVRLLEGFDPKLIGVIHDVGNAVIEGGEDCLASFEILGPFLAHVHVKNVAWVPLPGWDDTGATQYKYQWETLRRGQADIARYFEALTKIGYAGWVTLEDFSEELPQEKRFEDNLRYVRMLIERANRIPPEDLYDRRAIAAYQDSFLRK